MNIKTEYVIQNKNTKKFIAIDPASGGYPYEVNKPQHARIWDNKEDAHIYKNTFKNEDWELHTFSTLVSILPISWT